MKYWILGTLGLLAAATGVTTKQLRTAAPSAVDLTSVAAGEGSSLSVARADHTHSLSGTLPQARGGTGAAALTCATGEALTSNGTTYSCTAAGVAPLTGVVFIGQPVVYDNYASGNYVTRFGLSGVENLEGRAYSTMDSASTNLLVSGMVSLPTLSGTSAWVAPGAVSVGLVGSLRSLTTAATTGTTAGLIGSTNEASFGTFPQLRVMASAGHTTSVRYWIGLTNSDLCSTAPPTTSAASAKLVMAFAADTTVNSGKWLLVTGNGSNWSGTDTGIALASGLPPMSLTFNGSNATAKIQGSSTTGGAGTLASGTDLNTGLKIQMCVTALSNNARTLYVRSYGLDSE